MTFPDPRPLADEPAALALLTRAAEAAGEIALGYFGKAPETWDKPGDAGPVTEADLAADKTLRAILTGARPGAGWLSEESRDDPARLGRDEVFIVDPIDGTRAFIAGQKDWAISVALARGGRVVAGVVHLPARGLTYSAGIEAPALLNGAPIRVSAPEGPGGARLLTVRRNLEPGLWKGGQVPGFERHFRSSLAYRLALVAEGRFDAMLSPAPLWEWDIAAGALIAARAGARVTTRAGAAPVFNSPGRQVLGLVVAAPGLQAFMVGALALAADPAAEVKAEAMPGGAEPPRSV